MTERETPDQPATTPEEAPQAPTAPGNLDAMPHLHRRAGDNALLDEEGNLIPPGHESGRSGSADRR